MNVVDNIMFTCSEHRVVKACFFFSQCVILFQPPRCAVCEVLFVLWSSVKGMMGHGVCEVRARGLRVVWRRRQRNRRRQREVS